MSGSLLLLAGYGLLVVFLVGFVVRSVRIAKMPVHLRWELAPIPKEKERSRYGGSYLEEYEWWKKPREESLATELAYMLKEIVFLKALREHNPALWRFSFPFHIGRYVLIAAGGLAVLAGVLRAAGVGGGWVVGVIAVLAGVGNLLGALGLLGSRFLNPTLRRFTTPIAAIHLGLLAAVFVTGLVAVLSTAGFGAQVAALAASLLTARAPAGIGGALAAHVLVTLVFLAVLPFGQMMHFVAKYFTCHQVRWEDEPLEVGGSLEREVLGLLNRPVTWASPHVGADGGRTWVDIAGREAEK